MIKILLENGALRINEHLKHMCNTFSCNFLLPGELRGSAVRAEQSVPTTAGAVPHLERLQAAAISQLPRPEDARAAGPRTVPSWHAHGPVL